MQCHLLIPSLFPAATLTRENDPLHGVKAPALQGLLARGERHQSPATDMQSWLCDAFGVQRQLDYPVGSLSLLADGVDPGAAYWLRADPVHMSAERDQLILTQVSIGGDETDALVAALNRHFAPDGLHFAAPLPGRWYIRCEHAPAITTHGLYQVAGSNVHPLLPGGPDAMRWRALLNEIQMLLFDHPVNQARESKGEAPVNSVWPWGGGTLPHDVRQPFERVHADDPLAKGLALAGAIPAGDLPRTAEQWLGQATGTRQLLVLDSLRRFACYGDQHGWRAQLQELEQAWFVPLKQAVWRGDIELTLHSPTPSGTQSFYVSRAGLWKLWRPVQPLISYRP